MDTMLHWHDCAMLRPLVCQSDELLTTELILRNLYRITLTWDRQYEVIFAVRRSPQEIAQRLLAILNHHS